jgi:hypothetical protein
MCARRIYNYPKLLRDKRWCSTANQARLVTGKDGEHFRSSSRTKTLAASQANLSHC